jgi:hypothetical protein
MREIRSSGSVEGVMSNRDLYSDSVAVPREYTTTARPGPRSAEPIEVTPRVRAAVRELGRVINSRL